jgi:hypothetical protein
MSSIPARVVARLCHVVAPTFAVVLAVLALSFSAPAASAATPPAPPLKVGQGVFTTNVTNVRATADGTLIGTQPKFAEGSITAGPTFVSADSAWWVKVAFSAGPSGWVGADMLIDGVPLPPTVTIGAPGAITSAVLDENANIEVVYSTGTDANNHALYSFRESTNQGLSFSTPTPLPVMQSSQFQPQMNSPQIAVERNGALDIVFVCRADDCKTQVAFGVNNVFMIRSIDHGTTWSAPILIGLPPKNLTHDGGNSPVIAACGAGVTVAWIDDGIGTNSSAFNPNPAVFIPDLFVVNVVNGVPGAPLNVTDSPGFERFPQLLVNPQGTVYLSWDSALSNSNDFGPSSAFFASIPNCAAVAQ